MSKEKQIEQRNELLNIFAPSSLSFEEACLLTDNIINAGYRKQKYGKWKKRTFIIFDSEIVGYNCSECNTTWDTETKFCPNCGAKMSKGDSNEN